MNGEYKINYKKGDEPRKSEIEEYEKTKQYIILVNSLLKEGMDSISHVTINIRVSVQ